jgi:hypothetical protein
VLGEATRIGRIGGRSCRVTGFAGGIERAEAAGEHAREDFMARTAQPRRAWRGRHFGGDKRSRVHGESGLFIGLIIGQRQFGG